MFENSVLSALVGFVSLQAKTAHIPAGAEGPGK